MGDGENASLRLQFNPKVRLEFHGSTITSDAGLLAFREFDDALGLTEIAEDYLQESRTGRNILHHLVPLLRQGFGTAEVAGLADSQLDQPRQPVLHHHAALPVLGKGLALLQGAGLL